MTDNNIMESKVYKQVVEILKTKLDRGEDDIKPSARFIEDLKTDSLDIVEAFMALEESFNIEIKEKEMDGLKTVQDIVEYIEKRTGGAGASEEVDDSGA